MKVNHFEEFGVGNFCSDRFCGSLLSADIHENLGSKIWPFHPIINFYNFASTRMCVKAKLLRMVDLYIKESILGSQEQCTTRVH